MIKTRESLTSLLTGAGVAMVAITSLATASVTKTLSLNAPGSPSNFFLMIACSGLATILVLSHLHHELKLREKRAVTEARTDPLSGLFNRKAIFEALDRKICDHKKSGTSSCLAMFDLNNFKNVNDTLGHERGDELLKLVAARLKSILPADRIFRLGGDEFAVILDGLTLQEAKEDCRNLHQRIAGTYTLSGTRAGIGCSIGVALIDGEFKASDLMRHADLAMYKAKESRTFVEVFDQRMRQEVERKSELSKRLELALQSGKDITLKYQPIFSREKHIVALEVYFRWHDNEYGAIPPREAVHVARLTQQIDTLSLFVVAQAIKVLDRFSGIKMCVNLEAMQILDTRFSEALDELIASSGMPHSSFQLEFDESEIVAYGPKIGSVLRGLADCGFTIAVDNFGSSTSSLTELRTLGVTAIKFDNSVLANARDTQNISLLRAKVQLAGALGMSATCKGIADHEDETIALQSGCDLLQGFKYGRPDNAGVFIDQSEQILRSVNG